MIRIRQRFNAPVVSDLAAIVRQQVTDGATTAGIGAGESVAVAVGSRGISNLAAIVSATVEALRGIGTEPFIFPAMGSHGGATSEGQIEVLGRYGIRESSVGAPIRSEIVPTEVGRTDDGIRVYVDKNALAADHIVLINRVKPHTDFRGPFESGLLKMMVIGMGKHQGADLYHRAAMTHGFVYVITHVADVLMGKCHMAFGLAILENANENTAKIEAVPAADLMKREPELLKEAFSLRARLPFEKCHLLIVDWMGKNISGTGMDTNVIGRRMSTNEPEFESPRITRVFVRDLTAESNGNALGTGLADFTTSRLVKKIDTKATYINLLTGNGPQKGRIPMHLDTDAMVLDAALGTIGLLEPEDAHIMRIESTLKLRDLHVSEALLPLVRDREDLEICGDPFPMPMDRAGNLRPMV